MSPFLFLSNSKFCSSFRPNTEVPFKFNTVSRLTLFKFKFSFCHVSDNILGGFISYALIGIGPLVKDSHYKLFTSLITPLLTLFVDKTMNSESSSGMDG